MVNQTINSLVCSLCNGEAIFFESVQNRLYFQCLNCKGIQAHPKHYLNAEAEKARYDIHHNDVNDKGYQKFVEPIVEAVLTTISPSSKGLDYGCGSGPVITKLLNEKGYTINLYDPYYVRDTSVLLETYDYIICCEVIEHFYKPEESFKKMTNLTKAGGYLFIKTNLYDESIDFKNWWYVNDVTHVFFYTRETLIWISNTFNFSLKEASTKRIIFQKN